MKDFSIVEYFNQQLREYGEQLAIMAEEYLFGKESDENERA